MHKRKDITQYSEAELSLLVFNDEGLYSIRHQPQLIEVLHDCYEFTDEQLATLQGDLDADLECN